MYKMKLMNLSSNLEKIISCSIAMFLILSILIRSINKADLSWDSLAYHLPFTALRVGLLSPENYNLPPHLWVAYKSFPSFIYYLKGIVWRVTGVPETVQIVSSLSFLLYIIFAAAVLRIPWQWVTIGILSIPIVQIGASANMTDVPANIGLSIISAIFLVTLLDPQKLRISHGVWLVVGAFLAGGTKLQSMALASVIVAIYIFLVVTYVHKKAIKNFEVFCIFAVMSLIVCLYPAIRNYVLFKNPIYPIKLTLGPIMLNGEFDVKIAEKDTIQQLDWIKSVLEVNAFNYRPLPYTIDQGDVPVDAPSFRVGGYFFPLISFSIFIIYWFTKNVADKLKIFSFLIGVTLIVSSIPNSNELRYFSFWAINIVTIALWASLRVDGHSNNAKDLTRFVKVFLVICIMYILFITGGEYVKISGPKFSQAASYYEGNRYVIHQTNQTIYCYDSHDFRGAIFDSPVFGRENSKVIISLNRSCQELINSLRENDQPRYPGKD